jgi:hypothetical protein
MRLEYTMDVALGSTHHGTLDNEIADTSMYEVMHLQDWLATL